MRYAQAEPAFALVQNLGRRVRKFGRVDLQGNREPAVSSIFGRDCTVADNGGRFERVHEPPPVTSQRLWMADDCKSSAVPPLPRFAAGQMLSSSRGVMPFGGPRLLLETIRERGESAIAGPTTRPDRQPSLPASSTIPLQIGDGRIYEPYGVGGGEVLRASFEAIIPRGRDHDRPRAEREEDGVVEQRIVVLAAEAEVDNPGTTAGGLDDALNRCALVEDAEGTRIPDAQDGVRVDADDADAVVGRGQHGGDLRAMVLVVAACGLRVEDGRVRPAGEFGMAHVDARIDHGHRHTWTRRIHAVGAHPAAPPLQRDERIARLGLNRRLQRPIRPAEADVTGAPEPWDDVRWNAPATQLRHEFLACGTENGRGRCRLGLDEGHLWSSGEDKGTGEEGQQEKLRLTGK